jgi:serine protease Do
MAEPEVVKAVARSILSGVALLALASTGAAGQGARPAPPAVSLPQMSDSVQALVRTVAPSVVQLVVTAYRPIEGSATRGGSLLARGRSVGSGVVIDDGHFIVTNAHVVESAERIDVVVTDRDESDGPQSLAGAGTRTVAARVVGVAPEFDLALLAVDARLPALPLADYREVRQGELVFALGSPTGLRNSVSMGMVSAVARQADPDSPLVYVQTDAAINPGNSGGPLVNVHGEIVGINTMIRSSAGGSDGLGFALPSALVALAFPQLRDFGHLHRAVTGLSIQTVTPLIKEGLGLAAEQGLLVSDVTPGSTADLAGVQRGDVITSIDGERVETLTMAWLYLHVFNLQDGQAVTIDVLRGDKPMTETIMAVLPPHVCERQPALMDTRDNVIDSLGIMGVALDVDAARAVGLRRGGGVAVAARLAARDTADVTLEKGDVIYAVNGTRVASPVELRAVLARLERGSPIVLDVERGGTFTYVAFEHP